MGPRVNEMIVAPALRLVDDKGEMAGVISIEEALKLADEAGLDLVEVAPNADPPVCKLLDYGKYKYEAQKKANVARKKQKLIEVKEVKMRPGIDVHDYDTKMRSMVRFLGEGDKVKVTVRFRGREMLHQDLGMKVLTRIQGDLDELAKGRADAQDGRPAHDHGDLAALMGAGSIAAAGLRRPDYFTPPKLACSGLARAFRPACALPRA